jgi:hypothetical protein
MPGLRSGRRSTKGSSRKRHRQWRHRPLCPAMRRWPLRRALCYHPQALSNEHFGRGVAQPGSAHRSGR